MVRSWMRGCPSFFWGFSACGAIAFPESQAAVRTTTYVSEEVCAPGFSTLAALYARDTVPAGVCTPGPGSTVQTPSQTTLPVCKALVADSGHCTNPRLNSPPSAHSRTAIRAWGPRSSSHLGLGVARTRAPDTCNPRRGTCHASSPRTPNPGIWRQSIPDCHVCSSNRSLKQSSKYVTLNSLWV